MIHFRASPFVHPCLPTPPYSLIIIFSTCHHLPNLRYHSMWTLDPWRWRWHHHVVIMQLGHSWPIPFSHNQTSLQWSPLVLSVLVCQFLLSWVNSCKAFCLYITSDFFCSPTFCPNLGLYLIPLQSLFYSLSNGTHLFLSYFSSVHRLKAATPPLDLPCSRLITHSRAILTTGKSDKQLDRLLPKDDTNMEVTCPLKMLETT